MQTIHVCLVSDQPIPNLTTALQFRPDTIVLLYTDDKITQKKRLERVLKKQGFQVMDRVIQPYGMGGVIETCEAIIKDYSGDEISLNITGGTKIGTLGTFQAFYNADLPIYYVNTQGNEIIRILPGETVLPIEIRIPIKDYLAVYGFSLESNTPDEQAIRSRKAATEALRDLAITSDKSIGKLNGSFPDKLERASFPLETSALDAAMLDRLVPAFEQCGIAKRGRNGGLLVESMEKAKYLRGFWFEEYVFMAAKGTGADEVLLNVEGKWDVTGSNPPKNEFDVMMAKGNRLFFVSCKTSNPDRVEGNEAIGKDYLYELDSLGDQVLGLFGKKMLASARPVTNTYLKQRAKSMNIRILDRNDLANLKGKIQEWLSV